VAGRAANVYAHGEHSGRSTKDTCA
jgi:hypothetical protein